MVVSFFVDKDNMRPDLWVVRVQSYRDKKVYVNSVSVPQSHDDTQEGVLRAAMPVLMDFVGLGE
jgi:hypothetical protein